MGHRTTGVIEQKFEIKGTQFHIFDVGGQRSERKKWIRCFEHVTAVIFVASLSCFDEVMFEDDTQNAMIDSVDLFAEKIEKVPLTVCFEEYDGEDVYDDCVGFIR